jgi:hypothetical protein
MQTKLPYDQITATQDGSKKTALSELEKIQEYI